MTGDAFRRAQPGQPLQIPAAAYNAFLDASAAQQKNQKTGVRSGSGEQRSSTLIRMRNSSGVDLKQFEVIGIDEPIFDPQDSLDAFRREVTFRGVVPDEQLHSGRFVVLQEPVRDGGVGLAVVVGLTIARLHDPDDGPEGDYADVRQGVVTSVRRRKKVIAPIVWADDVVDDNDLRWVVIHLNPQPIRATTTTTTCSPTTGHCLYEAVVDVDDPEVTHWVLVLDENRQPVDRCTANYSCQPPTPDPTPEEAEAGEQRRTCCTPATTSTSSTTTTPAPCSGSCVWLWNDSSKTWTVQTTNCGSQCACDAPGFCGASAGETTRTDCISGGAPPIPYCGGSTTTCPPATTSPNGGCGTGCTYYYRFGAWHLIENHCTGSQCSCCPPVGIPAGDPECQTLTMGCCFPPPPPPPPPPPACLGSCEWVWEPIHSVWVRMSGSCSSGIPGGCECAPPGFAGTDCSTRATTRCAPPPGGSTTTADPCEPPPPTTTGNPNRCEGYCRWKWNGSVWVLVSSSCATFCPCDAPPPFPGTQTGQVQLVRCTFALSCCEKFGDEWDLPIKGIGLCAAELGQSLHMIRTSAECWQWSDIFDCGDFAQLTVCCKGNGDIRVSYSLPCATPAAGACTVTNIDCDPDQPTFDYQCIASNVSGCLCCDEDPPPPTTTSSTTSTTSTTPIPTTTSTTSTTTSTTTTTTAAPTTPPPSTTTYVPPPSTTTYVPPPTTTTGGGTTTTEPPMPTTTSTSTTSTTTSTTTSSTTSTTTTPPPTTTVVPTTTTYNPPPSTTTTSAPTTTTLTPTTTTYNPPPPTTTTPPPTTTTYVPPTTTTYVPPPPTTTTGGGSTTTVDPGSTTSSTSTSTSTTTSSTTTSSTTTSTSTSTSTSTTTPPPTTTQAPTTTPAPTTTVAPTTTSYNPPPPPTTTQEATTTTYNPPPPPTTTLAPPPTTSSTTSGPPTSTSTSTSSTTTSSTTTSSTTTSTTSTTPPPQCTWQWSGPGKQWVLVSHNCGAGQGCGAPGTAGFGTCPQQTNSCVAGGSTVTGFCP